MFLLYSLIADFIQGAIEIEDGEAVEETSYLSASEENLMELNNSSNNDSDNSSSSGEGKSSAIRYIPGFELLGSLTCRIQDGNSGSSNTGLE